MEEISWRQKSRELWLKEGNRNTGYFHRMANAHRRRNCLRKISINGKRLEKEAEIKEGLIDAFKNLLSPLECGVLLFLSSLLMKSSWRLLQSWKKFSQRRRFGRLLQGSMGTKLLGQMVFPLIFGSSARISLSPRC